ncbi:acyl carrier protein [Nocardia panacis]|uniref:Acyl carrier protein n=1 Tax=Nocardia panacis TaxID=2340916 RepID=A0A3A4JUZ2_9NOCA|nr:phosphopantetheine-binding protein [Nocardia panacis]RJO70065.1 acyl carrier protein [Nocardia panacis]
MGELCEILLKIGVEKSELAAERRLRSDLALDSTETVELEGELRRRFGVEVDLWDKHDYTIGELAARIDAARARA